MRSGDLALHHGGLKMKKRNISINLLIISFFLILPGILFANNVNNIIQKANNMFVGNNIYSVNDMTIYRSGKLNITMKLENFFMKKGGKSYSLAVYKKPGRMKGTAYLMIENDLWIRFSSTGRIRKLSSSAKKNSAAGTDFSYNDMGDTGEGPISRYDMELVDSKEDVNGEKCYKIICIPKHGEEQDYEKLEVYISTKEYYYIKIDYFRHKANIKTLTFSEYRTIGDKIYPYKMVMESHIKPTKTEIITKEIEFNSSRVKERYFNISYLERIK
ncbi:hypothetical protein DRP43_00850 [candidate division TA06 bacterium]|uniref:Uncharacterized protein TP-0789 domain-containing protein n=1 Tax=candidate division TA06 bacterium TaxID=2250710 RepID=A0A660SQN3_UNCT6|nr:MAG: hypothetical protein DRP43_00850 [candidate division TA06 bacterium]